MQLFGITFLVYIYIYIYIYINNGDGTQSRQPGIDGVSFLLTKLVSIHHQ